MRPISLRLHDRPITQVLFNREGDLCFVASKDNSVSLWYTSDGQRIGTYRCNGVVFAIDVSQDSKYLVTASGDAHLRVFNVKEGRELEKVPFDVVCRSVEFAQGDKQVLVVNDQIMGVQACIHILDFEPENVAKKFNFAYKLPTPGCKILQATWGPLNKTILAACEDGAIRIYDTEKKTLINTIIEHTKPVQRIEWTKHKIMFVSCSKDGIAKLYDSKTFKILKTFDTGRPINTAGISPIKPHILFGGGQSAESVTTSRVDSSQFKVRFYHIAYGDEIGGLIGHIGPVHSVTFTPDGKTFATGGEEGLVQINHFDDSYFNFDDDLVYAPTHNISNNNNNHQE
ncbi:WD40 repeat-containing protein [Tieghemostelium lacteum]|uniref:Eukaryotic translation initiation factor 3 subunit I n=1 Tax=Tieghemostelium lacteum TaxID=361077 RepID=G8FUG9_TIELA|nr:eukaryotic translation initiation factor 3 subunit I [Tieghemostelium lacteum]KYR02903.1 WD40 repeat-containing protein [Tieghemostelium lacteum]|eukprot:KYR02903.1 WD40 repeat-containing protein [Tieghemostelium lacteum]